MVKYAAVLPRKHVSGWDVDLLTGLGGIVPIFVTEYKDRRTAVRELGDEYGWIGLDREWWARNLMTVRGKHLKMEV